MLNSELLGFFKLLVMGIWFQNIPVLLEGGGINGWLLYIYAINSFIHVPLSLTFSQLLR